MGSRHPIATLALAAVTSLVASACVEPTPTYDDWTAAYVAHGPLEPTSAVVTLEQVTHTPYDEMFQALSPDGGTLLYVAGWFYLDQSIEDAHVEGIVPGTPSNITRWVGGLAVTPSWLPDGSGFLYATNVGGPWQLVRSRSSEPDAAYEVILTDDAAKPLRPTVAPDGLRFAFSLTQGSARYVAVANIDGSDIRVLHEGDYPSWSPAGDEIVFQGLDAYGQSQLFAVHPDGGELQQRTFSNDANVHPAHDPTGELVVFGSTRGHEQRICKVCCGLYVMGSDGSDPVQLVGGDVDADWPSWGSDGWIYFTSNEQGNYDVWRVRLGSGDGGSSRVPADPTGVE